MEDAPLLDEKVLANLSDEIGTETVLAILKTFFKECEARKDLIPLLLQQQDWTTAKREAHSMISSAASFGAMRMSKLGSALEIALKEGNTREAETLATHLPPLTQSTLELLEAWIKKTGA